MLLLQITSVAKTGGAITVVCRPVLLNYVQLLTLHILIFLVYIICNLSLVSLVFEKLQSALLRLLLNQLLVIIPTPRRPRPILASIIASIQHSLLFRALLLIIQSFVPKRLFI